MIIELEPVDYYCLRCDSAMEWTTCHAPLCRGYRCLNCGYGCDLREAPEDGECALSLTSLPFAQANEIREERRLSFRYGRPVRRVNLPGECA